MDITRPTWRKSTYSGNSGGNCVEVAGIRGVVAVRDSKNPDSPALAFSPDGWQAFTGSLKGRARDDR